jgi:hypothetical protein
MNSRMMSPPVSVSQIVTFKLVMVYNGKNKQQVQIYNLRTSWRERLGEVTVTIIMVDTKIVPKFHQSVKLNMDK